MTSNRPLHGIRIIDLSMGWAGPLAARNLADLGAVSYTHLRAHET